MAQTIIERTVVNKGKRVAKKLSAKQVKFFGTPAQKAALRRSRAAARTKPNKSSARTHSKRTKKNAGELIGYTLVNSGRKQAKRKMAKTKTTRSKPNKGGGRSHSHRSKPKSHRSRSRSVPNTGQKRARRHVRNAGSRGDGITSLAMNAVFVIAGAVGSKLLTQMVLGANNTGVVGYLGNAVAGGLMFVVASKVSALRPAAKYLLSGTAVQIVLRLINDYTPFGQYVANLGMGDYQAQAFVSPQILEDPYNSARIRIPGALQPPPPPPQTPTAAAAAAGVGAYGGGNLYGGQSNLY